MVEDISGSILPTLKDTVYKNLQLVIGPKAKYLS